MGGRVGSRVNDGLRQTGRLLGGAVVMPRHAGPGLGMARHLPLGSCIPGAIYALWHWRWRCSPSTQGLPLSIRSIFYRFWCAAGVGLPGHIIDILAVFATLFGLADLAERFYRC